IDLLISTGRRGAYLVTGRRGAGKTSFVKHCISEYEGSVLSRFLRGNVGRGVWDRTLILLFWLAILLGLLLLTELIQFFTHSSREGGNTILRWLILAPIGLVLLYPCVYAKVVLEACISAYLEDRKSREKSQEQGRWAGAAAIGIVFGLAFAIGFCPFFGNPAHAVSLLLPPICALYATAQAVSFRHEDEPPGRGNGLVYFVLFTVLLVVSAESAFLSPRSHLPLSLVFLGSGACLRGLDQGRRE